MFANNADRCFAKKLLFWARSVHAAKQYHGVKLRHMYVRFRKLACSLRSFDEFTLSALITFATISVAVHSVAVSKIAKAKREWIGFAASVLLVLRTVGEAWRNRHVCFESTYSYTLRA
tara:strand:+ start:13423 stop:13776 length:354 start_codon:yes stop_codon:yes gene_type:complete